MTWFSFLKIIFWRFVHVECITTSLALITVYRVLSKEYLTLFYFTRTSTVFCFSRKRLRRSVCLFSWAKSSSKNFCFYSLNLKIMLPKKKVFIYPFKKCSVSTLNIVGLDSVLMVLLWDTRGDKYSSKVMR